ncbi:MAG: hypothetical protein CM1200mP18_12550 [Gammaproteobacteria bacterium]|nr:MAG: hypothetical protein CM1200mP18_12550 [Gammaproteobacteria bacterium]
MTKGLSFMTVNHIQSHSGDYRGYDIRPSTEINEEWSG